MPKWGWMDWPRLFTLFAFDITKYSSLVFTADKILKQTETYFFQRNKIGDQEIQLARSSSGTIFKNNHEHFLFLKRL